jgi:inositol oxygenase
MSTPVLQQGSTDAFEPWEEFVRARYDPNKKTEDFRNYGDNTPPKVREFYRINHANQTRDFVLAKKQQYGALNMRRMTVWEAMEFLNTLVDDSDPDTDLSQIDHCLQSAEAARRDGHPRWMIMTALVHDLGKILCLYGEPQWAVVGDTFPVGCAWSDKIVFHEFFAANPDRQVPLYQTLHGVYEPGCGLDQIDLSWGHDEYLYHVMKPHLPPEALAIIRYHSFYPWHREGAYAHFMNDTDRRLLPFVQKFNPYDLYSKSNEKPDLKKLRPYYDELINEFAPGSLAW